MPVAGGTSTPKPERRKFYTGESAAMSYRRLKFARNWWRHKKNSAPPTMINSPGRFSAMQGNNGLYWKAADGETESPIGPRVAAAVAEGYTKTQDGAPIPYLGYYYRIVTRQGKNSPGGSKSYVVKGKMTGGFAFVAYPAEYRSSGVKTFMVGPDGVVYEKDLGPKTTAVAGTMKEYNPNSSWQKAEDQEEIAGAEKTE